MTNDGPMRPIGEGLARAVILIVALAMLVTSDLAVDMTRKPDLDGRTELAGLFFDRLLAPAR